jgi:hypothetical protein
VAGLRRAFLAREGLSAWGARIGLERRFGPRFDWAIDLDLAGAHSAVTSTAVMGDASGLLISSGGFVSVRVGGSDLGAALGAGARGGLARLEGHPRAGATVLGDRILRPWIGPAACLRLFGGRGRLGLSLTAEAGLTLVGADGLAGDATALAVSGAWGAVALGTTFRL